MNLKRREKWDNRHLTQASKRSAAAVLKENISLLPKTGLALDIACGKGVNSFFLASLGMEVIAWDFSKPAIDSLKASLKNGEKIYPDEVTIFDSCFEQNKFDLILCCHFLDRSIAGAIYDAVVPGGLIIYQTFTSEGKIENSPSNPEFLLNYRELFFLVKESEVLSYREQLVRRSEKDPMFGKAYMIAKKASKG